ncbi:putative potassium channel [Arabidopsis thaliana]|jgi:potassium channel subfamily K|uniref:Two-pore potassium channel 5 n=1 Tax=Arabidopsis thaliana TaxID=3702 RepID=KCO5_ARATH|nr:Ca2+ activated outward rectifying K+ channel 5 [Arabidopsis thaliana]Q9S6Z8.1 RecName: Full=Two-pore potassium channel 5; Short=AtTPK5; AltName: Full=Calcium-activated outward-rectifying potassium channel 5, chloroplastic; Short=AtKCO5 [Arabidopsis thaliana]AAD22646.1 putative potassium channel [Arabidopsis thaliana]AAM61421.1 putative potassium channel [Arabidopsis thaliana]AEE82083.1 Ca2+ activated outward rectifying K+ channel 5 [Arabidopsis thaliana]CAB62162.1 KCO5 protein [Arabidopsis |eukprot:NP_192093.1 Ca2+ activated outward rectifying K+ channel 5 [Arabidopsis thaliana]
MEPLISPQPRFRLQPIPENPSSSSSSASITIPRSISNTSFFHEISQERLLLHHQDLEQSVQDDKEDQDSDSDETNRFLSQTRPLHRSRTAPAMVIIKDLRTKPPETKKPSPVSKSIIRQAIFLLIVYLTLGVSIYSFNRDHYSGIETHPVVDALYFCIVTMCTIGYGDIAPLTPWTKIFAVVFVLFGFGFLDILLSGVVNYVLDLQESMILTGIQTRQHHQHHHHHRFSAKDYIIDFEKGRMRIRMKVCLALCVVVLCIGVGALVLHFVEELGFVDSVYLSVMSVTTVGYGDRAFKTLQGRLFAAVWLLVSTLAVARAFLYLAEARIDRRHRKAVKLALNREITVDDLLKADTYQHGFISKSEYIVLKLKEMGKITQKDIDQVVIQFEKLDPNQIGKITLPDLLGDPL